jgi:hypothetical protein
LGPILRLLCLLAGLGTGTVSADFDPTAPPKMKSNEVPTESSLAWVRINGRDSIAWYNGTVVKLGDRVEGGRIVAIREDHIVLAGPRGRRTVSLLDPQVQHKPMVPSRSRKH